jgi:nucleoside-diphosphate-sugar epimerase
MIVGRGVLANAFKNSADRDNSRIIFASGVSNSLETKECEFERESDLLHRYLEYNSPLIYFSTCSLYYNDSSLTPYMAHKLELEKLVLSYPENYVFRLSQVVGSGGNPATIANYLHQKILSSEHFLVYRNTFRNLIDAVDCVKICGEIMSDSNLPPARYSVKNPYDIEIVRLVGVFEEVLNKKANYSMTVEGSNFIHESRVSDLVAERLAINFGDQYVKRLLEKYYAK